MSTASIDQLAALLRYCEDFAKHLLREEGAFYPFGAFLDAAGRVEAVAGQLDAAIPNSRALYAHLQGAGDAMLADGRIGAYALAAPVDLPPALGSPVPDGIRVHIQSGDYARTVYLPYRVLPWRPVRRFLAVVPVVEYYETIAVDVDGVAGAGVI
jgi:hypothetical protein